MQKKRSPLSIFVIFLLASALIFGLSKTGKLNYPSSLISSVTSFFSKTTYNIFSAISLGGNSEVKRLKEENGDLRKKLLDQEKLIAENKALHDQFQVVAPKSYDLVPAKVVGAPRLIPGISNPETFIIEVGSKNNVKLGSAVVVKENLIGRITKLQENLSEVTLVTNPASKFTAKTTSGVLGIIKGEGNDDMVLDNVLLSDNLKKGEFVLSGGDQKLDGGGFPPDLVIGKIISVDKNPSQLFQKGKVQSLLDFRKITTVFVVQTAK